jgi:hypothetical protein
MLKMSTSFFQIASAFIFAGIGLGTGIAAQFVVTISIGTYTVPSPLLWTVSGACFLMAYSALRSGHKA